MINMFETLKYIVRIKKIVELIDDVNDDCNETDSINKVEYVIFSEHISKCSS